MLRKYESKRNLEELTDTEIYAAIRYLEPELEGSDGQEDAATFVQGVILLIPLLGCAGLIWFYQWVH